MPMTESMLVNTLLFVEDSSLEQQLIEAENSKQVTEASIQVKSVQKLERKGTKKYAVKNLREKKRQATQTISWLREHYCSCPNVCLPREIIYEHYLEFCSNQKLVAICKATFGKIIRNTFPKVTSKRLGARGQSRYHYNGIGIKQKGERNQDSTHSRNAITRFSPRVSNKNMISPRIFSLNTKVGTLLPRFPDINHLIIADPIKKEKVRIFLTMYRMHCQCIVDVAISGNFEEIRMFLLHFWQGFPDHLTSIFVDSVSLDLISGCDSILYRTLSDILIPSEVIDIPEKLLQGIQNVAGHWEKWLECSLENMNFQLRQLKIAQGRRFSNALKRNAAFLHLAQISRPVLNESILQSFCKELAEFNKEKWLGEDISSSRKMDILYSLLEKEPFVDSMVVCLDDVIQEITKDSPEKTRNSILHWVYILKEISYYMTVRKSKNFVPFHLLSCLFQEYLMLAFESQRDQKQEHLVHAKLKLHLNPSVSLTTDYIKSATSCFLVTNKKPQCESRNTDKRKRDSKERKTNRVLQKHKYSVDLTHLKPPNELGNCRMVDPAVPLSEHAKNKSCSESQYIYQHTDASIADSFRHPCASHYQLHEHNTTSGHFAAEVQYAHCVNEQIPSFLPLQMNNFNCNLPPPFQSNVQYDYFKSDFIAGHTDTYNSTMIPTPFAIEPCLNYLGYTDITATDYKTKGFVT